MEYPEFLHDHRFSGTMVKVYMAWRSFDQGSGVWASNQSVALKLGVTERAVQQNTRKLQSLGVIEIKEQFSGDRQLTNFCLFPAPPGANDDSPNTAVRSVKENQEEQNLDSYWSRTRLSNLSQSLGLPTENWVDLPGAARLASALMELSQRSARRVRRWKQLDRRSPFYTHRDARQLVDHFEKHLLLRSAIEKEQIRNVSANRRVGWVQSANKLLDDHPLQELMSVIDWVFISCSGVLPFVVENDYGKPRTSDRKVTRLALILNNYSQIRGKMLQRSDIDAAEGLVDADQPRGLRTNYGEPFADFEQEAQIIELVDLFTHYRGWRGEEQIHPTRTWRWAKSFRIMLAHRKYEFDDVKFVVTALADRRWELDFGRYHDAYDLHRDSEWVHLMAAVKIKQMREEMRESAEGKYSFRAATSRAGLTTSMKEQW